MTVQLSYDGFVSLIEEMAGQKETGTLFLRTNCNHSIVVGIQRGEIVTLIAGSKRGSDALPGIISMSSCSLRRDSTAIKFPKQKLSSTSEILVLLRQIPESNFKPEGNEIDAEQVGKTLCNLLHEYLGPVAPLICEDISDHGRRLRRSDELARVIEDLAKEIDSADEAWEFEKRARASVRSIIE